MKFYCPMCNFENKGDVPGEVDEVEYGQLMKSTEADVILKFLAENMGKTITKELLEEQMEKYTKLYVIPKD